MKVHPSSFEDHHNSISDDSSSDGVSLLSNSKNGVFERVASFCCSIRFCLINVFLILIVITTFLTTAVWVGSFSSSLNTVSAQNRQFEFDNIIFYVDKTLNDVVNVVETYKRNLMDDPSIYLNYTRMESSLYKWYKSELNLHASTMVSLYVGDPQGNCGCMIHLGTDHMWLVNKFGDIALFYNCEQVDQVDDTCHRSVNETFSADPFTMVKILETANKHPNDSAYTLSYADLATPNIVFLSLISSIANPNPVHGQPPFMSYVGYDLSTETVSNFLGRQLDQVGAEAFILEMKTNYIIASNHPEIPVNEWDSNGTLYRKTPFTFPVKEVNVISKDLLSSLPRHDFSDIGCGHYAKLALFHRFVTAYRMCNSYDVDWLIVYSVPTWNYFGSLIVGIIVAAISTMLILSVGVSIGIMTSVRIIRPIHNLIDLFHQVSAMQLESLHVLPSNFSEVKEIQKHFAFMVKKILAYRAFIPSHLLSKMDEDQVTTTEHVVTPITKEQVNKHTPTVPSDDKHDKQQHPLSESSSSHEWVGGMSSSLRSHHASTKNLFALGLEQRPVTVLAIQFGGLSLVFSSGKLSDSVSMISDWFELIQSCCKTSFGHVGNFQNDILTISWNATFQQGKHEWKAASSADMILKRKKTVMDKWSKLLTSESNDIKMALCTQACSTGNVGCESSKQQVILGSIFTNLQSLLKISHKFNISFVASENVQKCLESYFMTRMVAMTSLLRDEDYESVGTCGVELRACIHSKVYEIGESSKQVEDEWMYELSDKEKKNKWLHYNQACTLLMDKQFEAALEKFSQLSNPDGPTSHMIEQCKARTIQIL